MFVAAELFAQWTSKKSPDFIVKTQNEETFSARPAAFAVASVRLGVLMPTSCES